MGWGARELREGKDPEGGRAWLLSRGPSRRAEAAARGGPCGLGSQLHRILSPAPGQSEIHPD